MEKIGRMIGKVIGNCLNEKALAIAFFAGHPEVALVWAITRSLRK